MKIMSNYIKLGIGILVILYSTALIYAGYIKGQASKQREWDLDKQTYLAKSMAESKVNMALDESYQLVKKINAIKDTQLLAERQKNEELINSNNHISKRYFVRYIAESVPATEHTESLTDQAESIPSAGVLEYIKGLQQDDRDCVLQVNQLIDSVGGSDD